MSHATWHALWQWAVREVETAQTRRVEAERALRVAREVEQAAWYEAHGEQERL